MVYFVNMPFWPVFYPGLGLSVISTLLRDAGIPCKTFYFNHDFAKEFGIHPYDNIACCKKIDAKVLDWIYSDILWGKGNVCPDDGDYFEYIGISDDKELITQLKTIKQTLIGPFMEDCISRLNLSSDVQVVGFSCLFQTLPYLAVGKRIKELYPHVKVAYGGASVHGEIGEELFDRLDWIDALCTGEAEDIAVELFRSLLDGRAPQGLRGVLCRDADGNAYKTECGSVPQEVFDNGLVPEFDDYFDSLERIGLSANMPGYKEHMALPFESSRGCWWMDKQGCTFCGLNGIGGGYRLKRPEHVLDMLEHYSNKYGLTRFQACENNMDMSYFDTFLPRLKDRFPDQEPFLYYCVKSNLNREQMRRLAQAGVAVAQPGIESLSDHLLGLMNKGVRAIQNLFFLKCAREYGVFVYWYMLMRIYGEAQSDYDEMTELLPKITHFNPPGISRSFVICQRYSAYYKNRSRYFNAFRPSRFYDFIYPPHFDMNKLAYFFDVQWKGVDNVSYEPLAGGIENWHRLWKTAREAPVLAMEEEGGLVRITDTRWGTNIQLELDEEESRVYRMLDDVVTEGRLIERLGGADGRTAEILGSFVAKGLAVHIGGEYLGLALRQSKAWSLEERRQLLQN